MRALARWGALPMLAAPLGAWALGLGDIELRSALNQPFSADIALVSATREEVEGLRVNLAEPDTFARYGLERPAYLSGLTFNVVRDERGRDVVRISSRQSITEPFVTLLIEATYPRGRLLREYTVLLDPPVLLPQPAMPAQVQPAETLTPQPGAAGVDRPQAPPPQAAAPAPAPAAAPSPARTVSPAAAGGSYGPVQRAETLWSIASRLQPDGVTLNQMMLAIFEANPQAFDGNMNVLHAGAVLRIPEASEVRNLSAAAASTEFQRQLGEWQALGDQQAQLRLVAPSEAGPVAGAGGAADAPPSIAATDAELARLEQELSAARAELEESQRLLEIRNEELLALQTQLSAAEQELATAAPDELPAEPPAAGVDFESEPLFADEIVDEPAEEVAAAAEEPAAAEPEPAAAPAEPPAVVSAPAAAEPSLLSRALGLLAAPLLWIGLGVAAVLGAAVWFLRHRRDDEADDLTGRWDALQAEMDDEIDAESAADTERMRRQVRDESIVVEEAPPRDAGRDTARRPVAGGAAAGGAAAAGAAVSRAADTRDEDTLSSQTVINLDQTDVLAEADFHMAYGLYDQAAELVSNALEQDPKRRDLKLKLLEVFFVWGNRESFLDAARSLRSEIGDGPDADWDKVVIMGKQICPDEDLFAQATAVAGELDMALELGDSPSLDLTLEDQDGAAASADVDFGAATDAGIDFGEPTDGRLEFDLGGYEDSQPASGRQRATDERASFEDSELDIGEMTAAGLEAAITDLDDDTGRRTPPDVRSDALAATQESPTVESPQATSFEEGDDDDVTVESPATDTPTMETPTVEMAHPGSDEPTVETPTVESQRPTGAEAGLVSHAGGDDAADDEWDMAGGTTELPTIEQPNLSAENTDYTAEIDLDALGLDVDDLRELPEDLGEAPRTEGADTDTREQPTLAPEDQLLSATGVTQVLEPDDDFEQQKTSVLGDDDRTLLSQGIDDDDDGTATGTTVLPERFEGNEASGSTSLLRALRPDGDDGEDDDSRLDLNLDDLSAALDDGHTVEQPRAPEFSSDVFGGGNGSTPVDLDVGSDPFAAEEPTGTEEISPLDPQTMTEVGTKLDLARAYIDMGDPEGARSILEEVLDEGDSGQRREAQGLIETLSA